MAPFLIESDIKGEKKVFAKEIMLYRISEEKEAGFTLVEIMVTLVVFGIIAALGVGAFLNQRSKNVDKEIESEVKAIALDVADIALRADLTPGASITFEDNEQNTLTDVKGQSFFINVDGLLSKEYTLNNKETTINITNSGSTFKIQAYNPRANKYKSPATAYTYDSEKVQDL